MPVTRTQAIVIFNQQCDHAVSLGYHDIRRMGWRFGFSKAKRVLGLCNYSKRLISVSTAYMADNDVDQVTNTIKHEIAHALTQGDGHGEVWRSTFIKLGGDGKVMNDTAKPSFRWAIVDTTMNDAVVAEYFSKPRRNIANLEITGRPETYGKLKLVKVKP